MNNNYDEDIIAKIYYNELNILQELPNKEEYTQISKKIRKIEKRLLQEDKNGHLRVYMECINERIGIEAEKYFEMGFKTAVKILFQALK